MNDSLKRKLYKEISDELSNEEKEKSYKIYKKMALKCEELNCLGCCLCKENTCYGCCECTPILKKVCNGCCNCYYSYENVIKYLNIAIDEAKKINKIDSESMYHLACLYKNNLGIGTERHQLAKAKELFESSVKGGYYLSYYELGIIYFDEGVTNYGKKLILKSIDKGNYYGYLKYGEILKDEDNENEANHYFELASNYGISYANYHIGCYYEKSNDLDKALLNYEKCEDSKSKFRYAVLILKLNLESKYDQVFNIFEWLVEYTDDSFEFGSDLYFYFAIILTGKNKFQKFKNNVRSIQYLEFAAEKNNYKAQYFLGILCRNKKDFKNAIFWLELSSSQSNIQAYIMLPELYYEIGNYEKLYRTSRFVLENLVDKIDYINVAKMKYFLGFYYCFSDFKNFDIGLNLLEEAYIENYEKAGEKLNLLNSLYGYYKFGDKLYLKECNFNN
jgi:TPR repeat protein